MISNLQSTHKISEIDSENSVYRAPNDTVFKMGGPLTSQQKMTPHSRSFYGY